jgi:hypothetical protein
LPRGNARDAVSSAPISSRFQLAVKDTHPLKTEQFSHLAPEANFVDLSVESHSAAGKKYGHRAVAYLNQADHKWYVLDPYTGEKF